MSYVLNQLERELSDASTLPDSVFRTKYPWVTCDMERVATENAFEYALKQLDDIWLDMKADAEARE